MKNNMEEKFYEDENIDDELDDEALEKITGGIDAKTIISAAKAITGAGISKYRIDPNVCVECGYCLKVCMYKAISAGTGTYVINSALCKGCGACLKDVCPVWAISAD